MGRGEGRGVTIGIDLNLPCLGVAFIANSPGTARAVLEACQHCGIELGEPIYLSAGLCATGLVELPWYADPAEWVVRRVEGYLKRALPEARRAEGAGVEVERRRLRLPVPEGDAVLGELARRRLLGELPTTAAEDLECLVYEWSRERRRKYK